MAENISFCGYSGNDTVKTVRDDFSDEDKAKKLVEKYGKKPGKKEAFAVVMALLLDGAKYSQTYHINYVRAHFEKKRDASAWDSYVKKYFPEREDINTLLKMINEDNTLESVYNIIKDFEGIANDNKRNKLLNIMKSEMSTQAAGSTDKKDVNYLISQAIEKNKQVIFTGAPGTGKTYCVREYVKNQCKDTSGKIDEKQYKFVQFHPSYDYSDFVEGLRPVVMGEDRKPTFVRIDGVFKEFCRHIVEENKPEKKYYFIVDEINRADLSKVFGELMFALEETYRGAKNAFDTQYKNLDTYRVIDGKAEVINKEDDVFREGFYIPENLYFIGTMNDIDRSVDSMDFALRRRFKWVEIKANEIMKISLHDILNKEDNTVKEEKIEQLVKRVEHMNDEITSDSYRFGLTDAYHIGPAYFKKVDLDNLGDSLTDIFETNITSILKEYTRGRDENLVSDFIYNVGSALLEED